MTAPAFHTLRWLGEGRLELLDQRALPAEEIYLTLTDAAGTAWAIRELVVRGAPAIGCAAALGVAAEASRLQHLDHASFRAGLEAGFRELAASRPTAVNLFWALERMRSRWEMLDRGDPPAVAAGLEAAALTLVEEDRHINVRMGAHGAALVPHDAVILTHCNAGALATAGHGTALGVVRSAVAAGKQVRVYADETRPVLQGARLTAWELARDGISVTVLPDGASGHLMSRERIDLVVVGADRVAANGDVANKIGTYNLAVLARRHRIPFYVACPCSTFDLSLPDGSHIPIESRAAGEVHSLAGRRLVPEGVAVFNPAFDVTPADLITALITEVGVIHSPDTARVAAALQRATGTGALL